MDPKRKTQNERLLNLLCDGQWHSGLEFVNMQPPILSYTRRIHELREREGFIIEGEKHQHYWRYRLVTP